MYCLQAFGQRQTDSQSIRAVGNYSIDVLGWVQRTAPEPGGLEILKRIEREDLDSVMGAIANRWVVSPVFTAQKRRRWFAFSIGTSPS